ncbi:MAG: hypothetical protein GX868_03835 [Actinobacteria bacterium]|nr:hypothetical protein [Actinomycetota bacterium]
MPNGHDNSADTQRNPFDAWRRFTSSLDKAGAALEAATEHYSEDERGDAVRALHRAVTNQLARVEIDETSPEMLPFNGWRQKFFMDNPDCGYFVAEIRDDARYRITGTVSESVFTSVTVYAGTALETTAVGRITSDEFDIADDGTFAVTLGGDDADLDLPTGSDVVWVRHFHEAGALEAGRGTATIERLDRADGRANGRANGPASGPKPTPPGADLEAFAKRLRRSGRTVELIAAAIGETERHEAAFGFNTVRSWEQMSGGAVYTEPGISYVRGSWSLEEGEALVVDVAVPQCRHWSMLLYSRHLNSLDARNRTVSLTGRTAAAGSDGGARVIISAEDPGLGNHLDTEGRRFGVFVIRALQPVAEPELPTTFVTTLDELRNEARP